MPSWLRVWGWFATIAAVAIFAVMATVTGPHLSALTGEVGLFDTRLTGYDSDTAREILRRLGEEGRSYYAGAQHALDTLFPPLFGLALAYWILRASRHWREADLPLSPIATGMLIGVAFLAVAFDLAENAVVGQMLALGPERLTDGVVSAASMLTVFKWLAVLVACGSLLVLALGPLVARRRRPPAGR